MNANKILPVIVLIVMAVLSILIRQCRDTTTKAASPKSGKPVIEIGRPKKNIQNKEGLDRTTTNLYFTKHAKCRMKCQHITQQEVKAILQQGTINYNKSELNDPRGPTYAIEGVTTDRQHVRIIVAPKKQHLTVVTVIDLEVEYECNCN